MGLLRSVAESEWAGVYTLTFQDGKYLMVWQSNRGFSAKCQANYEMVGAVVRLTYYTDNHECEGVVEDIQWRIDDDGLHLHLVAVNDSFTESKAFWEAKPWQKSKTRSEGLPPNGVWQVELTADDFVQRGVLQSTAAEMAGVYTWTIQDGKAKIEIHGPSITVSCMVVATVNENIVRLQNIDSHTCDGDAYDEVQWWLDADGLHFHVVGSNLGLTAELKAMYETKPWQKIAHQ